ncbi:hypothetical protein P9C02_19910 [Bacillus paralicheniformis]|nr:hypothetical protein [Bacillus paralicheniformis]MEC1192721.1 hypothetical protein [Bacillus paralicheniformis]
MAGDFFEFGSSGDIWFNKDRVDTEGISVRKMTIADFAVHPLTDGVVLATYRLKDETRKQRCCAVQSGSGWRMCFHQGTPIKYSYNVKRMPCPQTSFLN